MPTTVLDCSSSHSTLFSASQAFICPLESWGVFVMSITLGWALLNLILAPQSVHFFVIPGLEGAIDATP